ncbi:MAG: MgtC/SapB family protein [Candidatus Polarisedimenticolia bacterium]
MTGPLTPGPIMADFLLKALLAIACGGLIGAERELKKKPAGFRTNILICLGSMLFMWLSSHVALSVTDRPADPGRIAAQIVTGIGFLGAGTIIQARGRVVGLTSAAMIWVVSAVGMSIGAGYHAIAGMTTVLILLVLVGLGFLEQRVLGRCVLYDCQVGFDDDQGRTRKAIDHAVRATGRVIESFSVRRAGDHLEATLQYCDVHPNHRRLLSDLWKIDGVREVRPLR